MFHKQVGVVYNKTKPNDAQMDSIRENFEWFNNFVK